MKAERVTVRQGAIISAYTGTLLGSFADMQAYAEEKLGRPVWTHEFGNAEVAEELRRLSRDDFLALQP